MRTFATLALLAVANAVHIQDGAFDPGAPTKADMATVEECACIADKEDKLAIDKCFDERRKNVPERISKTSETGGKDGKGYMPDPWNLVLQAAKFYCPRQDVMNACFDEGRVFNVQDPATYPTHQCLGYYFL